MTVTHAIILGLVQGLTEFLPISSTGHLSVARLWFGVSGPDGTAFDAFLHLGTLLAVLIYFYRVWWGILRGVLRWNEAGQDSRQLAAKLAVATIPGVAVGFFLQDTLEWMSSPRALAGQFLVTAAVLLASDWWASKGERQRRITFTGAWVVGLAQVAALIPAVSRSGVTIAAGQTQGLSRVQAVRFSFLMSAPIIAGAGLVSLADLVSHGSYTPGLLVVGLLASLLAGFAAIAGLLKLVEKISFWPFVIYLVGLSAALLYVN